MYFKSLFGINIINICIFFFDRELKYQKSKLWYKLTVESLQKRLKRPCLYRTHTKYITVAVKSNRRTTITDTSTDIKRLCVKGLAAPSESIIMKAQGVTVIPCSMPPNREKYNLTLFGVYIVLFKKENYLVAQRILKK